MVKIILRIQEYINFDPQNLRGPGFGQTNITGDATSNRVTNSVTDTISCMDDRIKHSELMAAPFFLKDVKQHAFWDNNLFGVIIADESGNYVDANTEVSRMTGYNVDELKGMNVLSPNSEINTY